MATKTKLPTRNALYRMQGAIAETLSDNIDEYHFVATGRSTRFEKQPNPRDRKRIARLCARLIVKEMHQLEATTAKYLAALRMLHEKMTTTEEA